MKHNLDGRTFRSVVNTSNGEVGPETIFRYHQSGNIVSAEYSGGAIVIGNLLAAMDEDGRLEMRYHHLNDEGELMVGRCVSLPNNLPKGAGENLRQKTSGEMSIPARSAGMLISPLIFTVTAAG